jgi:hypothetical protein
MATTDTANLHQFIAYFEEPEPGVPLGCTGWYHSSGQFPVQGTNDVFNTTTESSMRLLKPQITGPFHSREQAVADLQETLSE